MSPASTNAVFSGSCTALVTPFKNGEIDKGAFCKLVDWQIENGTAALIPVGTTGESPTLSHQEHDLVVELCIKQAAGRVPVIAGAGSNSTAEAMRLAKHGAAAGADAVLIVSPYYNKPTQEGLYQHYKKINDNVGIPIIIYNIPSRSVIDMNVDTMAKLYELKNIKGVKDATGDLSRVDKQLKAMGKEFIQLTGNDDNALEFNKRGGIGSISVTANIAAKLCSDFQKSCANDFKNSEKLDKILQPLHNVMFIESNPSPVKYAASLLSMCKPDVRLPLVQVKDETKKKIFETLKVANLL